MIQFWILMLGQLLSVVVQPQTNKPARLSGKNKSCTFGFYRTAEQQL